MGHSYVNPEMATVAFTAFNQTLAGNPCRFSGSNNRSDSITRTLNLIRNTSLAVSETVEPQNFTVVDHKTTS